MATKTAAAPKLSRAQMIDMRMDICRQIEALEVSKKALADKIAESMKADGLTKAYGTSGQGYQLTESIKADYADGAVAYVKKQGIAPLFQSEPSITRSKVMKFLAKKKITLEQFNELQKHAGPDYSEFVLKKAGDEDDV